MKKSKSLMLYLQFALLFNSAFVHAAGVSASESDLEFSTIGNASGYTLTKITDESSISKEDFVVTKYLGDASSGNLTPVKYLLTFNNPLGDDPSVGSPAVRYFKWSINENGNRNLVNTGPYDTAKDITAYSSNNVRLDTASNWTDGSDVNNSFLNRGTASVVLQGGAIYNPTDRFIYDINSKDFIANFVEIQSSSEDTVFGGSIYNAGYVNNIRGNFINNYATGGRSASGGAIYNDGRISGILEGHYIANYTNSLGGAICNGGYIYGISSSDFIGNYTTGSSYGSKGGGAIYNSYYIGFIYADFINNTSIDSDGGGAIFNDSNYYKINTIVGDFIGNSVSGTKGLRTGGAIYNAYGCRIGSIIGDFVNNHADTTRVNNGGGAIYNDMVAEIETIEGNFVGNYVYTTATGKGGAIHGGGSIQGINGNFIENHILSGNSGSAYGGALSVGNIDTINGNFIKNYTSGSTSAGGAISGGNIESIAGSFIGNYAYSNNSYDSYTRTESANSSGGAISGGNIEKIVGNFVSNCAISSTSDEKYSGSGKNIDMSASSSGGAISSLSGNVAGDFINNYVFSTAFSSRRTIRELQASARGGAIYNLGNIVLTNSAFKNNYAKASASSENSNTAVNITAQGGAIYATGSTATFNVSEGKKIRNYGNYVEVNGVKDDANGGFLYMANSSLINFNTEKNSSYIIGDGIVEYDSIASDDTNNIINKNGKGEVVVNSSMEFYTGTLNVNEGSMTVNNKLGASAVRIASGASLSAKVNGNGSTFTNAALNYSNDGTLNLLAGETLASGNYDVFVFENPETVYFGNVKSYGGTFDHATGTFVTNDALNITIGETNSVNVQSNGRILAVGAGAEDTSIVMNFNSAADVTVNSVFDTSASDDGFAEIVGAVNQEDLLLAEAFAFDVENLGAGDTVSLSFFVGSGYDISQFTVYHKDAELGWELADISNLEYDGEYLSFIVDGFSSYGYVAAVPEPSRYAAILGFLAITFAIWRRRI